MFVQVIKGQVADAGQIHGAVDEWVRDVAPGADGWLGTTAGVTDDGTFLALARFESEDAARTNSARPEQDQWWSKTAQLFTGDAEFRDSVDVLADTAGDPDAARFVQIMQGETSDPARARELWLEDADAWREQRPDMLGSVEVGHEGGAYTMALYFTSEEEARIGESKPTPPELQKQMDEMNSLTVGQPSFYDIKEPWLYSR